MKPKANGLGPFRSQSKDVAPPDAEEEVVKMVQNVMGFAPVAVPGVTLGFLFWNRHPMPAGAGPCGSVFVTVQEKLNTTLESAPVVGRPLNSAPTLPL